MTMAFAPVAAESVTSRYKRECSARSADVIERSSDGNDEADASALITRRQRTVITRLLLYGALLFAAFSSVGQCARMRHETRLHAAFARPKGMSRGQTHVYACASMQNRYAGVAVRR